MEIAVAAGVLAAVMLPVMLAFSSGSRGIQMTHEDFMAHQAALELIEQVQAAPFWLIPLGKFTNNDLIDGKPLDTNLPLPLRLSPLKDLERACAIEAVKKDGKTRFKKITVTLFRKSKVGKGTPLVLKALVANDQL